MYKCDPAYSDICLHYDKCLQVLDNCVEVCLASFFPKRFFHVFEMVAD